MHLTLVGTNDWHGWVKPHESTLPDGTPLFQGGAALFVPYLEALRKDNPGGVVLLDAGDLFQGTLVSNLTEGAVVIDAFNRLGYAAAAIGNHEFDYGPLGEVSVATDPSMDPFGALKARIAQAKFPLLAVNLYDAHSGARPGWLPNDGTVLVEVKGLKVGILGLTTPSTPYTTNPVNVASLRFGSLVPETQAAAARLRQQGADVVIAVSHAGGKCPELGDPHDLSSCDAPQSELFILLDGLPEGTLDAIVAGHTHAPVGHFIHGTPAIETYGMGSSFGTIDLYVDPTSKRVLPDRTKIHANISICERANAAGRCDERVSDDPPGTFTPVTFLGTLIKPNAEMQAVLRPALAKVDEQQRRSLGVIVPKKLGRNYEAESPLGSVFADTLREMEHADVALLNSGGLRADLRAGELTFGDVYEVIPFDNTIATLELNGAELKRLLQQAYNGKKGVFQESGLKLKLGMCAGQGRLKSVTLSDGKPLAPEKRYRVVLPDFLARGGDGLGPVIQTVPEGQVDLGMSRPLNFRDGVIAQLKKSARTLVAPTAGRISFVDDGGTCNAGSRVTVQPPGTP